MPVIIRFRQLDQNLKKNATLRGDVVRGALAPAALIGMSADDLATSAQRAQRERARTEGQGRRHTLDAFDSYF